MLQQLSKKSLTLPLTIKLKSSAFISLLKNVSDWVAGNVTLREMRSYFSVSRLHWGFSSTVERRFTPEFPKIFPVRCSSLRCEGFDVIAETRAAQPSSETPQHPNLRRNTMIHALSTECNLGLILDFQDVSLIWFWHSRWCKDLISTGYLNDQCNKKNDSFLCLCVVCNIFWKTATKKRIAN